MEYDVIGDIHGNAPALNALLLKLGYRRSGRGWSGPEGRMCLFVGDFIDRGKQQLEVVDTVRSLIEAGRAQAVMGDHELNAIAWHRKRRPDNAKNRRQHEAFLQQVGEGSQLHGELVEWFLTLPLWLDLPEIRVVHACWHPASLARLQSRLTDARLHESLVESAVVGASFAGKGDSACELENSLSSAVEIVLKGLEIALPEGMSFHDKDGHLRHHVRTRWWKQAPATYADIALGTGGKLDPALDAPIPEGVLAGYDNAKPLFLGHYWMTGRPEPLDTRIACVDYSAGKGGPLVAYCWRGEDELSAASFVAA